MVRSINALPSGTRSTSSSASNFTKRPRSSPPSSSPTFTSENRGADSTCSFIVRDSAWSDNTANIRTTMSFCMAVSLARDWPDPAIGNRKAREDHYDRQCNDSANRMHYTPAQRRPVFPHGAYFVERNPAVGRIARLTDGNQECIVLHPRETAPHLSVILHPNLDQRSQRHPGHLFFDRLRCCLAANHRQE